MIFCPAIVADIWLITGKKASSGPTDSGRHVWGCTTPNSESSFYKSIFFQQASTTQQKTQGENGGKLSWGRIHRRKVRDLWSGISSTTTFSSCFVSCLDQLITLNKSGLSLVQSLLISREKKPVDGSQMQTILSLQIIKKLFI